MSKTDCRRSGVIQGLLKLGFSNDDVVKFLGGNFMRVFDQVWSAGLQRQPTSA